MQAFGYPYAPSVAARQRSLRLDGGERRSQRRQVNEALDVRHVVVPHLLVVHRTPPPRVSWPAHSQPAPLRSVARQNAVRSGGARRAPSTSFARQPAAQTDTTSADKKFLFTPCVPLSASWAAPWVSMQLLSGERRARCTATSRLFCSHQRQPSVAAHTHTHARRSPSRWLTQPRPRPQPLTRSDESSPAATILEWSMASASSPTLAPTRP